MVAVPAGYRVEREERTDRLRGSSEVREVAFTVFEPEDRDRHIVAVRVTHSARDDEWIIAPGGSTTRCEANEARARAAALLMAADECDRRNA